MNVALIHPSVFPVVGYGGTERLVWWLAKGLAERGHSVTLCALAGSRNPFGALHATDFRGPWMDRLPAADVYHFFNTPNERPKVPYLVTIGGNAKAGERFWENTVFVSRNHADRHGGTAFVYNGIDLDEYPMGRLSRDYWIFLAKASWKVKNVRGAIRIARRAGVPLNIIGGGTGWFPRWRGVSWRGVLGGAQKLQDIQRAQGLLFPVLWHEPFGIAVIEALALGAPVVGTPFGSLPELVNRSVGCLGASYQELEEAIPRVRALLPDACRAWVESRFTHRTMAANYEALYARVLRAPLHDSPISVREDQGQLIPLPLA